MARLARRRALAAEGRDAEIARLMIERPDLSQTAIGRLLGIHHKTVSKRVQLIHARWRESALNDRDAHVAKKLAEIAHIKAKAWEAFNEQRTIRTERIERNVERRLTNKEMLGLGDDGMDSLKIVLQCIEREAALCGLDAPRKQEINIVVEKMRDAHAAIVAKLASILTEDQLRQLAEMQAAEEAAFTSGLPEIVIPARQSLPGA